MSKKILALSIVALGLLGSCKQDAAMPSDAEIAQKVQDKYGAELTTLQELKKMQCDESIDMKVSERLLADTTAK